MDHVAARAARVCEHTSQCVTRWAREHFCFPRIILARWGADQVLSHALGGSTSRPMPSFPRLDWQASLDQHLPLHHFDFYGAYACLLLVLSSIWYQKEGGGCFFLYPVILLAFHRAQCKKLPLPPSRPMGGDSPVFRTDYLLVTLLMWLSSQYPDWLSVQSFEKKEPDWSSLSQVTILIQLALDCGSWSEAQTQYKEEKRVLKERCLLGGYSVTVTTLESILFSLQ